MQYSIIYSFDCPKDISVSRFYPRRSIRRRMDITEGDEQRELEDLEGDWIGHKHRKICGILNQEQFERFVEDCSLQAEDVETGGSIGAPGFGYGCVPAISFNNHDPNYQGGLATAYVTPFPESDDEAKEKTWETVRRELIDQYR